LLEAVRQLSAIQQLRHSPLIMHTIFAEATDKSAKATFRQNNSSQKKHALLWLQTTMHLKLGSNLIDLMTPNQIRPRRVQPDRVRHFLRQGLFIVFLGIACAVPVMAAPIQLPAIVEPARF
jgi:hypothetical protein